MTTIVLRSKPAIGTSGLNAQTYAGKIVNSHSSSTPVYNTSDAGAEARKVSITDNIPLIGRWTNRMLYKYRAFTLIKRGVDWYDNRNQSYAEKEFDQALAHGPTTRDERQSLAYQSWGYLCDSGHDLLDLGSNIASLYSFYMDVGKTLAVVLAPETDGLTLLSLPELEASQKVADVLSTSLALDAAEAQVAFIDYRAVQSQDGIGNVAEIKSSYQENTTTRLFAYISWAAKVFSFLKPRRQISTISRAGGFMSRAEQWVGRTTKLIGGTISKNWPGVVKAASWIKQIIKISGYIKKASGVGKSLWAIVKDPALMLRKTARFGLDIGKRALSGIEHFKSQVSSKAQAAGHWLVAQKSQIGVTLHQGAAIFAKASTSLGVAAIGLAKTGGQMLLAAPFRVLSLTLGAASAAARMWHSVTASINRGHDQSSSGKTHGAETQAAKRLALALASVEHYGARAISETRAMVGYAPSLLHSDPHIAPHLHNALHLMNDLPKSGLGSLFQDHTLIGHLKLGGLAPKAAKGLITHGTPSALHTLLRPNHPIRTASRVGAHLGAPGTASLGPTGTGAQLAAQVLANPHIRLAGQHVSRVKDEATPATEMSGAASGHAASRSHYENAPGGVVDLDPRMLSGMLGLSRNYSFTVSEIAGGSHSKKSRHYAGIAFDVSAINGRAISSQNPYYQAFMAQARQLGATEVLGPGDAGHSGHVHVGWPRTAVAHAPPHEAAEHRAISVTPQIPAGPGSLAAFVGQHVPALNVQVLSHPTSAASLTPSAVRQHRSGAAGAASPTRLARKAQFQNIATSAARAGDAHPEITAAQWALESGWGAKVTGTSNFFGQKAKRSEPGSMHPTHEQVGGNLVPATARFRDYPSLDEGVADHVRRWNSKEYAAAPTDVEAIGALQKHHYATDANYAAKLLPIIQQNWGGGASRPKASPAGATLEAMRPGQAASGGFSPIVRPMALQRKGTGAHPDVNPASLRSDLRKQSGGFTPDSSLRARLGGHLGFDPGGARLHTGPAAAQASRALNAEAFTIGNDVFFGDGRFDPHTPKGLGLIAHELTHVGQQTGTTGSKARFFTERGGDEMEREAQQAGERVLANVGSRSGLFVEDYVREYEGEGGLTQVDQQRLDRISVMALDEAQQMLASQGVRGSVNADALDVSVDIDLGEMSDGEAARAWAGAITAALVQRSGGSTRQRHSAIQRQPDDSQPAAQAPAAPDAAMTWPTALPKALRAADDQLTVTLSTDVNDKAPTLNNEEDGVATPLTDEQKAIVEYIKQQRAAVDVSKFKLMLYSGHYGYVYGGNPNKDSAPTELQGTAPDGDSRDIQVKKELWKEIAHEGGTSSLNAYDSQKVTWGRGLGAVGGQMLEALDIALKDDALRQEFLKYGITYANKNLEVVNTDTGGIEEAQAGGKKKSSNAFSLIQADPHLLGVFSSIAENPAFAQKITDAEWETFLHHAGKVPDYAETDWDFNAIRLVSHITHWGPALGWGKAYESTGGDIQQIVLTFGKRWGEVFGKRKSGAVVVSADTKANFSRWANGAGMQAINALSPNTVTYTAEDLKTNTDLAGHVLIPAGKKNEYYDIALPGAVDAAPGASEAPGQAAGQTPVNKSASPGAPRDGGSQERTAVAVGEAVAREDAARSVMGQRFGLCALSQNLLLLQRSPDDAPAAVPVWHAPFELGDVTDHGKAAMALVQMISKFEELKEALTGDEDQARIKTQQDFLVGQGQKMAAAEGALTQDEVNQLAIGTGLVKMQYDALMDSLKARAMALVSQLLASLSDGPPDKFSKDTDAVAEELHNTYMSKPTAQRLKQLSDVLTTGKEYDEKAKGLVEKAKKGADFLDMVKTAQKLETVNAALGKVKDLAGKALEVTDLIGKVATVVGVDNQLAGSSNNMVNQARAGFDLADWTVGKLASSVPVFGTLWSSYYKPAIDACLKGIEKLLPGVDYENRMLEALDWSDGSSDAWKRGKGVAPLITNNPVTKDHFPGGQPVLDLMYQIVNNGNPVMTPEVQKFFIKQRSLFNAAGIGEIATQSNWETLHPSTWGNPDSAPNLLPWLQTNQNTVWAMLYGSIPHTCRL